MLLLMGFLFLAASTRAKSATMNIRRVMTIVEIIKKGPITIYLPQIQQTDASTCLLYQYRLYIVKRIYAHDKKTDRDISVMIFPKNTTD